MRKSRCRVLSRVMLAVTLALTLVSCGGEVVDDSPAFLLAVADTGIPEPGDALVAEYQEAIDVMEDTCVQDEGTSHGDYAIRTKQLLNDEGVTLTALIVLQAMAESAAALQAEQISCSNAYASFAALLVAEY